MADTITTVTLKDAAPDRFVPLRKPLGVSSFGINQLVLEPGQRMRIHIHEQQEEVYVVLAGTLTLVVEGEDHDVHVGEVARIAPETRRQVVNRGPDRLSLVAIGGSGGGHESRDARAFTTWDGEPRDIRDVPLPDDLPADEQR